MASTCLSDRLYYFICIKRIGALAVRYFENTLYAERETYLLRGAEFFLAYWRCNRNDKQRQKDSQISKICPDVLKYFEISSKFARCPPFLLMHVEKLCFRFSKINFNRNKRKIVSLHHATMIILKTWNNIDWTSELVSIFIMTSLKTTDQSDKHSQPT